MEEQRQMNKKYYFSSNALKVIRACRREISCVPFCSKAECALLFEELIKKLNEMEKECLDSITVALSDFS